jgi:hypothetical protein
MGETIEPGFPARARDGAGEGGSKRPKLGLRYGAQAPRPAPAGAGR